MPSLYLIDTSGFIFRAYHALPPLNTADGTPTGAVFGFTAMLIRLLTEERPDFIAAVMDSEKKRSFREEIYPEYKANRPPTPDDLKAQFPLVKTVLEGFGIKQLECEGYEADDVIATFVDRARSEDFTVTVVSSDKDLLQLVDDRVRLLDTMKNRFVGPAEVVEKYGVNPAQLGDWLALVGDTSDNVPGIRGIGAKTATKLIQTHGGLESVLTAAPNLAPSKLTTSLIEGAEIARVSRRLVELARDCPVASMPWPELKTPAIDQQKILPIFDKFQFGRLRERLGISAAPSTPAITGAENSRYQTVLSEDDLDSLAHALAHAERIAVDVETDGLIPARSNLVGVSLSWADNQACYIPLAHRYLGVPAQLALPRVREVLLPIFQDARRHKILHHAKFDTQMLSRAGLPLVGVRFDTMLASYVLNPERTSHGLDQLAKDYLNESMESFAAVAGKKDDFSHLAVERATEYAARDADVTFRVGNILAARLHEDAALLKLHDDVELPLSEILAEMELHGCAIDGDLLRRLAQETAAELLKIEQHVQKEAGWPININSPKQLQELLFKQLQLPPGRKTKTGYSTDADILEELALAHPLVARIEEYRTLSKLHGTYLTALVGIIDPASGRIHTSYNQAVAATGRLSSSDPNLQNIPIRTELGKSIRRAFVAPPGHVLLSVDYSQIELRVLAHLSSDPVLTAAFKNDEDIHQRTAMEVFGVGADAVTAEQRRVAKAVNFGVIYGQTDWGLSRQLKISKAEAARYIEAYFARHSGVKVFMDRLIEDAHRTHEVRTLLGRKRVVNEFAGAQRGARGYAERIVRNTPIQGSAADILKLAMIHVHRALRDAGLLAPMILTVHDELVFEVREGDVARVTEIVRTELENAFPLSVPLRVDIGVGKNWAEAH